MHPAPFVWLPRGGAAPMTHAYFRREFSLTAFPAEALLHLYADTNYHLCVNGEFVGYGPARAYLEFPEYDTYDLVPMLRTGANVIAVHVLHVGLPTFHNLPGRAGIVAWGDLQDADQTISLSTEQGWLCREAGGYDPHTPVFSFAQGPIQIYDERQDAPGWSAVLRPGGDWQTPAQLAEQNSWGELRPRSIPPLTQDEILPQQLLGAYPHSKGEEIISFRLNQTPDDQGDYEPMMAFACTSIYSPRDRALPVGTYWGNHCLNGQKVEQQAETPGQMLRQNAVFDLKAGWNFLFIAYGMVQGIWEMHLAVPRTTKTGTVFSPERQIPSSTCFWTAGPMPRAEAEALLQNGPPDFPGALPVAWTPQPRLSTPVSPQKGMAWAKFGAPLPFSAEQVGGFALPAGQAFSLVFDMGREALGRIVVEFDAPAGTVIDVGVAETLRNDRPDYSRMVLMSAGERHTARGGRSRMETFAPRGFRYLQVAVSNFEAPVTVERVFAVSQVYPYAETGSFACSDPFFNQLWEMGKETLKLCSEDVITDCPWRERTLYAGDLLPESGTAQVISGDLRLTRRCLEVFLQSQNSETGNLQSMAPMRRDRSPLGDYPLLTVITAEWYCRLTGDKAFAKRCLPIFRALFVGLRPLRGAGGLFTLEGEAFLDWTDMTKTGEICALNALIVRSLDAWASLLVSQGEDGEAEMALTLARQTAEAMSAFWDEPRGAYADTIQNGVRENSRYVLSSAWPMLAGVTGPEQDARCLAHIREVLSRFDPARDSRFTSPYGAFFVLGAIYEKGDTALAEETMRRLWSDMVLHPTGTLWEIFNTAGSLCHAWSSAPTYYLSTRALGVRLGFPDAADLSKILIAPESETLSWARGAVPHPCGLVSVDWAVRGDRLVLNYIAPEGVNVQVVPCGRLAELKLYMNGSEPA